MDGRASRDPMRGVGATIPFAAATVLAWATVIVGSTIDWPQYALALALLGLAGLLGGLDSPRSSQPALTRVLSSLIFLAAVGLLRNSAGGISSGAAALALIPVFYTALYSEGRRELYIVFAGVALFYLLPIVLVGPPAYPHAQYRAALLSIVVSSIIGLATQRLVADVRHQAGEALSREHMLEEVNRVVRTLFSSGQARTDVCEAAKTISHASIALLFEPVRGSDVLRSTAMVGFDAPPADIPAGRHNAVRDAFDSGQATLITEDAEAHVGSRDLWEAAGCPQSLLYEPLLRGAEPVGVLVVGWPGSIRAAGPHVTVAALLAHEAAAVIDRADMVSQLTDMAQTDPLTGLPNRRAWDARLKQALIEDRRFTLAMLDFDHFKEFNDSFGHPAGDRLLKETAAVWRAQLRTGDLLARLGGEEFGLLLLDCDSVHAQDVLDRLRGLIYRNRTCSAGFAVRQAGESAEQVMARADAALYEAKTSGRDRACLSVR
jgi:diguanylate cyclase (GGDEF)-like protein